MGDERDRQIEVLYVDHDAAVAQETVTSLEQASGLLAVERAGHPNAALTRLGSGQFDCVLSAYQLPELDGVEFLSLVRERHGDLPFVLYPDAGSEALASEAISAGVTDYVRRRPNGGHYERLAERIAQAVHDRRADTERRESSLRGKADLLDQLFEQLPVSLYVKDRDGRHLYVSDYDSDPATMIGRTDAEIYGDEEFTDGTVADDRRVVETGEPIINKEEYNEDNGEWTLTSKVPWYGDDGEIKGLVGVTRFITEKKEYEREIERKNERLEKFASVVSHDLRNPLNVAIGNVDLLAQDYDDSRLERVETALDRMDRLIADLLELARQGQSAIDHESMSLQALARRAWETVETNDVGLEIAGDLCFRGDPPRVLELVENLMRNAVEHADPGTITVGPLSDGTGFFVADDGPGISEDRRDEVFEPGFSTAEAGTGFGLAIVEEIATGHDWTISVTESEAGGARFEITGVEVC